MKNSGKINTIEAAFRSKACSYKYVQFPVWLQFALILCYMGPLRALLVVPSILKKVPLGEKNPSNHITQPSSLVLIAGAYTITVALFAHNPSRVDRKILCQNLVFPGFLTNFLSQGKVLLFFYLIFREHSNFF